MPRIFDNIESHLVGALKETLAVSQRADFCVGYFNLRGWRLIDHLIEDFGGGDGHCCRLLVGMQTLPEKDLRGALSLNPDAPMDQPAVLRLRRRIVEEFRQQLTVGAPSNDDEAGLRRLVRQIRAKKVVVKLYLRHPLHAKLYLLHRPDPNTPIVGFLGSSNLTMAGLVKQGELNVDVLDHDACAKLQKWFDARWKDPWCLDISAELVQVIEESWAREEPLRPYDIYVKMAYHLAREARAGVEDFRIPGIFRNRLFDFQAKAVQIAARHVNQRGGVLIGDVVGLGKTLMASALAKIFEEDQGTETLIICPKNLEAMWKDYRHTYQLRAEVFPVTRVHTEEFRKLPRYRVVLIDESHNLRNREGQRYRAIKEYIERNESRCILLSATPYNKSFLDLSAQLRLFVADDADLGIRPDRALRELGIDAIGLTSQSAVRTLPAFERSRFADDWRELMRLYMVRRTRSFIKENYALPRPTDPDYTPEVQKYLLMADGTRSYFPERVPKTVSFRIDDADPADQYARLYADDVVDAVNNLYLPRYGLGNYTDAAAAVGATRAEADSLSELGRAGQRLMGFCRTNLFKRLESGGPAFLQSVDRHSLRNYVFLHAIEQGLPLPIGTQAAATMAPSPDDDLDPEARLALGDEATADEAEAAPELDGRARTDAAYRARAAEVYGLYATQHRRKFKWLRSGLFSGLLAENLRDDAKALLGVLDRCGAWDADRDAKVAALADLLLRRHPHDKVLIFTQFADTVGYLVPELRRRGVTQVEGVTGHSPDPTGLAWRFSPASNGKRAEVRGGQELRVLVATDVLSEGQNLQDCAIVVNYDLPWAIIRLIQRAGRVDRIGQAAPAIRCYSFLPADGVERIINLRGRVVARLDQNRQVVGTDEQFFPDEDHQTVLDLYHEKAGVLDGDDDREVDLASYAFQIWQNAIERDSSLEQKIKALPNVVYSTRAHAATADAPEGVLVYTRTAEDSDALAWIDADGQSVTESQQRILDTARCEPDTPAIARHPAHHDLVRAGVDHLTGEEQQAGGGLGRPNSPRRRVYEALRRYQTDVQGTIFATEDLTRAINDIYRYPLREAARDTLSRQTRAGLDGQALAELVITLRNDDRLCVVSDERERAEPEIICSLGLFAPAEGA